MQNTIPIKMPRHRWWRLILIGMLFEIVLIGSLAILPETWLASELRNFIIAVHLPSLVILNAVADTDSGTAVFALLAVALVSMGLFWALVFYGILRMRIWLWTRVFVLPGHRLLAKNIFALAITLALIAVIMNLLPAKPRPFAISPGVQPIVEANNAFAIDLYQKVRKDRGNLFFSPYSLCSALAMTYAGADGQTKIEMAKVLHFDDTQTNTHAAFQKLNERINQVERWNRIKLSSANSIWGQQNYPFKSEFLKLVHESYNGDAESVDFVNAPEAARKINSWVAQKTDGKIPDAIDPETFSPLTRLVLCNAIYFKGKWQTQFKTSETKPGPFYVSTNQTVTVPMMSLQSEFKTARSDDDSVQLVELPYVGRDLSMVIILPVGGSQFDPEGFYSLSDIEGNLTLQSLRSWLAELDRCAPHKTFVSIPRFTTTQSFDLSAQLKSLGMASAFDENRANFSGMDGTTELYLSGVFHKAFVEVDESGTEAAAASWVVVKTRSMPDRFIANHPFIFLIRDNATGAILFLGRIIDPTK